MNANPVEPPLKRLLRGGAAGVAVGAVVWLLTGAFDSAIFSWFCAAIFTLGAGSVCALGRLLFRRTLGPVVGLLLGFLLGFGMGQGPTTSNAALVGQTPPIAGQTLDGTTFDVASMRGKVVLVDFWATTCPPCVAAMPKLKRLHDELHGEGLEIVGVSTDPNRQKVEDFVKSRDLPWPQMLLHDQRDYRLRSFSQQHVKYLPHVILIGRDGRIAAADVPSEDVERLVRQLLAEEELKTVPAPAVPMAAWVMALLGAVVASFFQFAAETGTGRT